MNRKIKLSLFGTLVISSTLFTTLPIVSCSSNDSGLYVDENIMNQVIEVVTESLKNKMEEALTFEDKKALANSWKVGNEISSDELDLIKGILIEFKDGDKDISFNDAVKNITFKTETKIPNNGTIDGPELKINFKDGYNGNVSIKVGKLGNIDSEKTFFISNEYDRQIVEFFSKSFELTINELEDYEAQKNYLISNAIENNVVDDRLSNDIMNFTFFNEFNQGFKGSYFIDKIIWGETVSVPDPGKTIEYFTFIIYLKDDFKILREDIHGNFKKISGKFGYKTGSIITLKK